jgi:ABC-type antimicrobial peptide transport system permease subunit
MIIMGLVIGTIAALALTRVIGSLLYGIAATDPVSFAVAAVTLALAALAACIIPAFRATRIDPAIALRTE